MGFVKDIRDERVDDRTATPGWNFSRMPLIGHFARDPSEGGAINELRESGQMTAAYRAPQQQGYQNALANQMQLYQPYNEAIGRIYGDQAKQDLDPSAYAPAVTPEMLDVGQADEPGPAPGGRVSWFDKPKARRRLGLAGFLTGGGIMGAIAGAKGGQWLHDRSPIRKERRERRKERRKDRREKVKNVLGKIGGG